MNITFIGLGIMGSRMANNLLRNKVELTVFNRSQEAMKPLIAAGAKEAENLQDAVANADIVFSMLSTPQVVESIFMGEAGALKAMKANALWVDCTTVNPSFSLQANEAASQAGIRFLDAPVAGTKPHAANAELVFFVGGESALLEEVNPYLEMMGKKVLHIGETSKGSAFKMLVNVMLAQSMLIFSETILLGKSMGLEEDFLLNALPGLVVAAPFTKFKAEMIRNNDYEVQFPLEWMHKDLHLASLTANETQQPLFLANLTKELYAAAVQKGLGRMDFAAIHQYLKGE